MLTKVTIRNFKRFEEVEVELANPVVFIGPNDSGKTSVLQALALWEVGLQRWNEKRKGRKTPERRPGVTINRRDLIAVPVPEANLLWHGLRTRDVGREGDKQVTKNILVEIIVDGISEDSQWKCGLEFDYANPESFYCRPLRRGDGKPPPRMRIPPQADAVRVAFLPPMSGLSSNETRLDPGAISVRIGEGRTAEVLRNLCYAVYTKDEGHELWDKLRDHIGSLFRADLDPPRYVPERGEIVMSFRENSVKLDLSSSGRGLQQTLLLL
ncbi:MAG: AAA family ATPase, partial [Armatimonadota bacterium]